MHGLRLLATAARGVAGGGAAASGGAVAGRSAIAGRGAAIRLWCASAASQGTLLGDWLAHVFSGAPTVVAVAGAGVWGKDVLAYAKLGASHRAEVACLATGQGKRPLRAVGIPQFFAGGALLANRPCRDALLVATLVVHTLLYGRFGFGRCDSILAWLTHSAGQRALLLEPLRRLTSAEPAPVHALLAPASHLLEGGDAGAVGAAV
mmetsp:Transcript_139458/g.389010  ORF Transcript_139458/g.389010 Transcript_139458/m.389010 type:complete len:206 (+) Transcript_139458:293-910(+)